MPEGLRSRGRTVVNTGRGGTACGYRPVMGDGCDEGAYGTGGSGSLRNFLRYRRNDYVHSSGRRRRFIIVISVNIRLLHTPTRTDFVLFKNRSPICKDVCRLYCYRGGRSNCCKTRVSLTTIRSVPWGKPLVRHAVLWYCRANCGPPG